MLLYNVQQISVGVAVEHYRSYDSIIDNGLKFGHILAVRCLDGELRTANEERFLKIIEERGYVELRECPEPDNLDHYYTYLITRAYAD